MNTIEQPVRIFVGAHETELLAFKVLEHSIKRHTSLAVDMRTVDNSLAPPPPDTRFLAYTNFSYGRFAIPQLMGYQGRAIYMDSDMLVFKDIAELWSTPFNGAKILVEKKSAASEGKGRLTAVMLMDCQALDWRPEAIVAGLGSRYDYEELMSIYPLLNEGDLQDRLPLGWNSLDEVTDHTRLLHFTKIKTQPWVYPAHPWGQLWINEVKMMLDNGALSPAFIKDEIAQGHIRPSLLLELGLSHQHPGMTLSAKALAKYDKQAGYVIHQKLFEAMAQRKQAKLAREQELDPTGFRKRQTRRRIRRFLRHPVKFLINPTQV
ncbi:MAG: glycosyltransferase [Candidatus Competibacteraceae bacterium]